MQWNYMRRKQWWKWKKITTITCHLMWSRGLLCGSPLLLPQQLLHPLSSLDSLLSPPTPDCLARSQRNFLGGCPALWGCLLTPLQVFYPTSGVHCSAPLSMNRENQRGRGSQRWGAGLERRAGLCLAHAEAPFVASWKVEEGRRQSEERKGKMK